MKTTVSHTPQANIPLLELCFSSTTATSFALLEEKNSRSWDTLGNSLYFSTDAKILLMVKLSTFIGLLRKEIRREGGRQRGGEKDAHYY